MAISQRRPEDVVYHCDNGAQYTSLANGQAVPGEGSADLDRVGWRVHDNAMAESFSPRSNASCCNGARSRPKPKHA